MLNAIRKHAKILSAGVLGALVLLASLPAIAGAQTANVCRNVQSPCVTEDFTAVPISGGSLTSAARTTAQTGTAQEAIGYTGVRCVLDVTANLSAVTFTQKIQGYNDVSGNYFDVLSSTAANGTSAYEITIHPGTATTSNISNGEVLPEQWRYTVSPSAASTATYSAACARLP